MRTRSLILLTASLVAAATVFCGCQRRPLKELDSNVLVNITYDRNIVNYTMSSDPSLMRVIFYDRESGNFAAQAFTPSSGDYVNVTPGRDYHIIAYNFDTENTVINLESEHGSILATTNLVPETYLTRLRTRAGENPDEAIVFEPDHLFAGNVRDVHILSRASETPVYVIDVEAKTLVETWVLELERIQGVEYVASIAGVISGLSEYTILSTGEDSKSEVSVFLEPSSITTDGVMTARFNTFGYNPAYRQVLSLVITDVAGQGHRVDIDVSDQFIKDNPEQKIIITTDKIIIERPEQSDTGGGLAPEVGEWDDIEIDITI